MQNIRTLISTAAMGAAIAITGCPADDSAGGADGQAKDEPAAAGTVKRAEQDVKKAAGEVVEQVESGKAERNARKGARDATRGVKKKVGIK